MSCWRFSKLIFLGGGWFAQLIRAHLFYNFVKWRRYNGFLLSSKEDTPTGLSSAAL